MLRKELICAENWTKSLSMSGLNSDILLNAWKQGFADIMMLEIDGLFYHFILILSWKWSSIIYRCWLNQLRYITYEKLTLGLILSPLIVIREIHYLWEIDTSTFFVDNHIFILRYITYEELTLCMRFKFKFCNIKEIHYL